MIDRPVITVEMVAAAAARAAAQGEESPPAHAALRRAAPGRLGFGVPRARLHRRRLGGAALAEGVCVVMHAPVNVLGARAVDFEGGLVDLSWTPWRRIWLSSRDPVWTLVDAEDFDWLTQWQWNVWHGGRGKECFLYAKRNTGPRRDTVRMHRELQIRNDPRDSEFMAAHVVDHVNGQTLDNRRANRRWSTQRDNSVNRRTRGEAPSLDSILAGLLAGLPARGKIEGIPF